MSWSERPSCSWSGGSSREWRQTRKAQLEREPLCRHCKAKGRVTVATDVDHIVPLEDGGSRFDPSNVQSLCTEHHKAKTSAENYTRRTGKPPRIRDVDPATGYPLDPLHHWARD